MPRRWQQTKIFNALKNRYNKKFPAKANRSNTAKSHKTQEKLMRDTFPAQRTIGEIEIAENKIDVRSRDDIPLILLGLQHIYCTDDLREKVFAIIKEILPTRVIDGQPKPVSA